MFKVDRLLPVLVAVSLLAGCSRGKSKPQRFTGNTVVLSYRPEKGQQRPRSVYLAGNFNDWRMADPAFKLVWNDPDGQFEIELSLKPGVYRYKFVVDGEWVVDPSAGKTVDDPLGGKMGVFEVVGRQQQPAGAQ